VLQVADISLNIHWRISTHFYKLQVKFSLFTSLTSVTSGRYFVEHSLAYFHTLST
jgi:hypothetical protein